MLAGGCVLGAYPMEGACGGVYVCKHVCSYMCIYISLSLIGVAVKIYIHMCMCMRCRFEHLVFRV